MEDPDLEQRRPDIHNEWTGVVPPEREWKVESEDESLVGGGSRHGIKGSSAIKPEEVAYQQPVGSRRRARHVQWKLQETLCQL